MSPKIVEHPFYPWKYETLDGIDEYQQTIVEIKFANAKVHSLARRGQVIDYYYPQCQSQMECACVDEMYFLSCHEEFGSIDYQLVKVKKDPLFIQKLIQEELKFYDLMVKKIPPEEKATIENKEFDQLCEQYMSINRQISSLEKQKEETFKNIQSLCKGTNSVSSRFKLSKIERKGSVDYSLIPSLVNVDLELYRKPSAESWKISELKETLE